MIPKPRSLKNYSKWLFGIKSTLSQECSWTTLKWWTIVLIIRKMCNINKFLITQGQFKEALKLLIRHRDFKVLYRVYTEPKKDKACNSNKNRQAMIIKVCQEDLESLSRLRLKSHLYKIIRYFKPLTFNKTKSIKVVIYHNWTWVILAMNKISNKIA